MAITTAMRAQVAQLYVGLFGRAPERDGLGYWVSQVDGGKTIAQVAQDMYNVDAARAIYPKFLTNQEIVAKFYTNVLGRTVDAGGSDYWSAQLATKTQGQVISDMIYAVANYSGTDAAGLTSASLFNNKVAVGLNYAVTLGGNDPVQAANITALVTADAAGSAAGSGQTAANAAAAASAAVGTTFTLTTAADSFAGTAGNDTFSGVAGTGATLFAGDVITGGSGVDTLNIVTDASFTVIGTNVTGVEKFSVTNVAGAARTETFAGVAGVTDVVNSGSTANSQVTFVGLSAPVNVTVQNTTANTFVNTAGVSGSADTVGLTLSGAGSTATSAGVTIAATTAATNEYETLNIASNGSANFITLTTDGTQTSLKTVNITGAANLNMLLAADNIATSATVINASAATGNLTIGADAGGQTLGAANHNITLGSGNDTVYFGANLNGSDSVDGGAGTDSLGVSAAVTNTIMTNVKNFETIRFDVAGANITQDAGITSLAGLTYAVSGGNTLTLNNLASGASATVVGDTATLTAVLKDGSGLSDAVTVTINNGASNAATTLTTLTNVTGLETLNLVSGGGTGTNVITNDNVTAKQVITGSANLTITNAVASSQIDASGFTGKLNIKGQAAASTNIQGGSGADTIVLGTAADTVSGGAGNDSIQLGTQASNNTSGADVISLGAGNDTVRFVGNTAGGTGGSTDYSTFATITDFTVGTSASATDFLSFSGTDTDFSLKTAAGATTTTTGLAKGATAQGLAATDAMVVQSVGQNASAAALTANVSLFKLTTGVAFTTDIKGTFAAALGTSTVTGLGANGNYLVSVFDTTNNKMVVGVVNVGGNADADTALAANDFVNADIAVVGVVNMTAADYANFGATNLAAAF